MRRYFTIIFKAAKETAENRAMQKVACSDVILTEVDKFRQKFPRWPTEVPFLLQRLGLQYKSKNRKKQAAHVAKILGVAKIAKKIDKNKEDKSETDENLVLAKNGDSEKEPNLENDTKSDPKPEPKKLLAKSKKTKPKVEKSAPKPINLQHETQETKMLPLKEGRSGVMEVRRLKLDEIFGDDIFGDQENPVDADNQVLKHKPKNVKRNANTIEHLKDDPFFETDNINNEDETRNFREDDETCQDDDLRVEEPFARKSSIKRSMNSKFSESLSRNKREFREEMPQRGFRMSRNKNAK